MLINNRAISKYASCDQIREGGYRVHLSRLLVKTTARGCSIYRGQDWANYGPIVGNLI